jgi:TIGR03009 family protein
MRRDSLHVCVLAVAATLATRGEALAQGAGGRAPAAAPAAAPARQQVAVPDPARMKQLLRLWEQQSAKLKTLDVSIDRVDKSAAWGDEHYKGRALLRSPNLAWLDFQKVEQEGSQAKLKPHERIVCTGTEVWQYRSDTKQIFIFPLEKQMQKRALEEGPLPFLFNMRAADAEARYTMSLVNETKDYYVVSVVPKLKIDLESFSKAFLKLNKQTFLPDRIWLQSPNGKDSKDFTLTAVRPNAPVMDENFKGKPLGPPWRVVRNPEDAPGDRAAPGQPKLDQRAPAVGNRPQPVAQPAAPPNRRR